MRRAYAVYTYILYYSLYEIYVHVLCKYNYAYVCLHVHYVLVCTYLCISACLCVSIYAYIIHIRAYAHDHTHKSTAVFHPINCCRIDVRTYIYL